MSVDLLDMPDFFERDGMILREMDSDPVPFALFQNVVPTKRQIKRILARGYGLHLLHVPLAENDLGFLADFGSGLRHLGIADAEADVTAVGDLSGLETLSLNVDQKRPVDLSRLSQLCKYTGPLRYFESVLRAPRLRELYLLDVRDGVLDMVPDAVEELTLIDAQKLSALPSAGVNPALRKFYVNGVREFDLGTLSGYPSLEIVGLGKARLVTSADVLLSLPLLQAVAFDGCHRVEPLDSLLHLGPITVNVLGRNPFDAAFRVKAESNETTWAYHGIARRPAS